MGSRNPVSEKFHETNEERKFWKKQQWEGNPVNKCRYCGEG